MEIFCPNCGSQRRMVNKEIVLHSNDIEEIIDYYFNRGTQYESILLFLKNYHDTEMSLSTLKRHLRKKRLKRKAKGPVSAAVRRIIELEIQNSSGIKRYRSIWHKLRISYGISVKRDDVMHIVKEIDPVQSENRKARKLKRRIYCSLGPNAVWHADGYDKLKRYGFPIHGCVDGFSRRVLWLKVCRSNTDPIIPAHFYISAVEGDQVCPNVLITDCGTENGIMASWQSFFHNDVNAHKYGPTKELRTSGHITNVPILHG